MGIDLLDITFRIEKELGVRFVLEEWEKITRKRDVTVGDLYGLILKKLGLCDLTRNDIELNYHLWLEIQTTLRVVTGLPAKEIELGTPLEGLFPKPSRREIWNRLREVCSYHIRELDYPKAVRWIGFWLAAGVAFIEQFQIWQMGVPKWVWPLLGFVGIWMVSETYLKILKICAPYRTDFPSRMRTVKDLCRMILATNYREICERVEIAFDERSLAVWEKLVEILVAALGVEKDEVAFHSRLIRDLGMG